MATTGDAFIDTIYNTIDSTIHVIYTATWESYYGISTTVENIIIKSSTKIHPRLASFINTVYYHGVILENFIYIFLLATCLCLIFGSKTIVKWPLFLICSGVVIFDYFIYFFIIRLSIYIFETILIAFTPSECSLAAHQKHNADTYEEWREAAEKLDQLQNRSPRFEEGYNWKFLVNTTEQLKQSVIDRDIKKLLSVLQVCTRNNVGGIMNEELFNKTHLGEPKIEVNEFIDAVVAAIESVSTYIINNNQVESIENLNELKRVYKIFKLALIQYGETALCLSGGAGMGYYHYGVIKALLENKMLPKILSGTSAGAVIAAMVGTYTDEELLGILNDPDNLFQRCHPLDDSWMVCFQRYLKEGTLLDSKRMMKKLIEQHTNGYTTFAEAYVRTGRSLNISVSISGKGGANTLICNRFTTPDVVIASAVLASCALPILLKPCELLKKDPLTGKIYGESSSHNYGNDHHDAFERYIDGSFQQDLPLDTLSSSFNARFFIVSQTEPHLLPFIFNSEGEGGMPTSGRLFSGGLRGGFFLSAAEVFVKNHIMFMFKFMKDCSIVPYFFGEDFSSSMLQDTKGDITLAPPIFFSSYMKLFKDPSSVKDTEHVLSEGQKIVWKKLPMIRNRSRVHYAVQIAIGRLKKKRDHYLANGNNNSRRYGNHHHNHNVGMSRTISNDSLTGDPHHMYVDQDIHHTLDNSPQEIRNGNKNNDDDDDDNTRIKSRKQRSRTKSRRRRVVGGTTR